MQSLQTRRNLLKSAHSTEMALKNKEIIKENYFLLGKLVEVAERKNSIILPDFEMKTRSRPNRNTEMCATMKTSERS